MMKNGFRFDFFHVSGMKIEELNKVEAEVKRYIRQNTKVVTETMTVEGARALGAQALFGEKYGEKVRVVAMGRQDNSGKGTDKKTYSLELCGGTHVKQTEDIKEFVLLNEMSVSSGVRRIEALTGEAALNHIRKERKELSDACVSLRCKPWQLSESIEKLKKENKFLERENDDLRKKLATGGGEKKNFNIDKINGVNFLTQAMEGG